MSEFKTIPQAIKYEINKEGEIQTRDNKTPIIPSPRGSKTVKLFMDTKSRKEFNVDELVCEVFNAKIPKAQPKEEEITLKGATGTMGQCAGGPIGYSENEIEKKIMSLDTFTSVKIWKLHKAGIKNDRIMELVGPKNQGNVVTTISNFKESGKLRDKADKVKI